VTRQSLSRVFACTIALGALSLAGCSSSDTTGTKDEGSTALAVDVTKPEERLWPHEITASGALKPWQEMVISAETGPYRVASLNADVGTWARKGQVLAVLARDTLEAQRAQQVAAVAEAQANLAKARSDVERARQVGHSGALSAQQIESYKVTLQTSQASLDSAKAQLRATEVSLGQAMVRAPDSGVVSSRSANLGEVVSAGGELFRMVRQGRVEWQAELDSRQLQSVHAGQVGRVTLPGGAEVSGTIRLVAPTLSTDTSRGIAYVQLPVGSPAQAGMYAGGVLEAGSSKVLTVPDTAVVLRDGKSSVFVLGKGNKVQETSVTTGQRRDGRVAVTGVPIDAAIVKSGGPFLSDGLVVRVVAAKDARK